MYWPLYLTNRCGFSLSYRFSVVARTKRLRAESGMMPHERLSATTASTAGGARRAEATAASGQKRPARSVTVNLAESPLGWLFARGHINRRQFDAGERLRTDWERGQLAPRVTMAWDAAPVARGRGGAAPIARSSTATPARRTTTVRGGGRGGRSGPRRHSVAGGLRRRRHARGGDRAGLAGAGRASWCSASRSTGSPAYYRIR